MTKGFTIILTTILVAGSLIGFTAWLTVKLMFDAVVK